MVEFCKFDNQFKERSFCWINNVEMQKLILSSSVTLEQQQQWFDSLANRKDYYIWGIKYDENPIGAIGLKNFKEGKDAEYFGYIGEESYRGKGIGKTMMSFVETNAKKMGLESIYLVVSNNNIPALRLYQSVGYIVEYQTEHICHMRKKL